jgi:Domain of unknown function (DUF4760)
MDWYTSFLDPARMDERHRTPSVSSVHRGIRTEGVGVTFINTDGMSFIGPGSEWFWTAVSGIVLAVTFVAIYRQLALARGANAFAQLGALVDEWQGERLVRKRIGVLVAFRDGAPPADIPESPASAIANFLEGVGALVKAGHIDRSLIAEGFIGVDEWWGILGPFVRRVRTEDANPTLWDNFEWLARTLVRIHPSTAFDQEAFERTVEQRITVNEADLRDLEAARMVTVRLTPTPIPVTRTPPAAK